MKSTFRSALPSDAGECIEMRPKTRQNAISVEGLRARGITAESWAANIDSGAELGHVCIVADAIVAYCFGSRDRGEIEVLAVLPDFEGSGIGRELLDRTVETLAGIGHKRLYLGCSPDPESRSHGFYRHLGWRSTGTFDDYGDEILEVFPDPTES